jgi:hypothetical protein
MLSFYQLFVDFKNIFPQVADFCILVAHRFCFPCWRRWSVSRKMLLVPLLFLRKILLKLNYEEDPNHCEGPFVEFSDWLCLIWIIICNITCNNNYEDWVKCVIKPEKSTQRCWVRSLPNGMRPETDSYVEPYLALLVNYVYMLISTPGAVTSLIPYIAVQSGYMCLRKDLQRVINGVFHTCGQIAGESCRTRLFS